MPAYQPPHTRTRPPAVPPRNSEAGGSADAPPPRTQVQAETSGHTPPRTPAPARGGPGTGIPGLSSSTRDWTSPSRASSSVLASPASDIRPSTRTDLHSRPKKAVEGTGMEDMEFIQSVSRSGGDGAEGDALKNWGLQERYRRYIDERLDKHYALFPGFRDTPPPAGATDQLESLGSIVLLFRKLREGIAASGRVDDFAIEAVESSALLALYARTPTQLLSSLSPLVHTLYTSADICRSSAIAKQTPVGLTASFSELKLLPPAPDIPDNRGLYASLLLLYHLCHSGSITAYTAALGELTRPKRTIFRAPFADSTSGSSGTNGSQPTEKPKLPPRPFLHPLDPSLRLARRLAQILSAERFDPVAYWGILADPKTSSAEGAMISWGTDRVRERAWEVMKRAYLEVRMEWAGEWLGLEEGEVGEWAEGKGAQVKDGRIKLR